MSSLASINVVTLINQTHSQFQKLFPVLLQTLCGSQIRVVLLSLLTHWEVHLSTCDCLRQWLRRLLPEEFGHFVSLSENCPKEQLVKGELEYVLCRFDFFNCFSFLFFSLLNVIKLFHLFCQTFEAGICNEPSADSPKFETRHWELLGDCRFVTVLLFVVNVLGLTLFYGLVLSVLDLEQLPTVGTSVHTSDQQFYDAANVNERHRVGILRLWFALKTRTDFKRQENSFVSSKLRSKQTALHLIQLHSFCTEHQVSKTLPTIASLFQQWVQVFHAILGTFRSS